MITKQYDSVEEQILTGQKTCRIFMEQLSMEKNDKNLFLKLF